jgi:hypothetical protein
MSRIARWTLALVVALLTLTASLGSAFAEPRSEPRPPSAPPVNNSTLERAYQLEQQRLREQEAQLKQAGAYADAIQALITRLKEHHQETGLLERALATFRTRLAAARHEWELARDILKAHAGFDDRGKVTNADQARATVAAAHSHLDRAAEIMRAAYRDLSAALMVYRRTHHDSTPPQIPTVS